MCVLLVVLVYFSLVWCSRSREYFDLSDTSLISHFPFVKSGIGTAVPPFARDCSESVPMESQRIVSYASIGVSIPAFALSTKALQQSQSIPP